MSCFLNIVFWLSEKNISTFPSELDLPSPPDHRWYKTRVTIQLLICNFEVRPSNYVSMIIIIYHCIFFVLLINYYVTETSIWCLHEQQVTRILSVGSPLWFRSGSTCYPYLQEATVPKSKQPIRGRRSIWLSITAPAHARVVFLPHACANSVKHRIFSEQTQWRTNNYRITKQWENCQQHLTQQRRVNGRRPMKKRKLKRKN